MKSFARVAIVSAFIIFVLMSTTLFASGGFQSPSRIISGKPEQIAVADINKDGNLDLVVSGSGGTKAYLIKGKGDGTFFGATELPIACSGSDGMPGIAVGDINNDGNPDVMVTCFFATSKVVWILGNGDGTFQPAQSAAGVSQIWGLTLADFNKDGKLDYAVVTLQPNANGVTVGFGNGTGQFPTGTSFATTSQAQNITAGDVNGDGYNDVIINRADNSLAVAINSGAGTFLAPVALGTGASPSGVIAKDITGDGKIDIVSANSAAGTLSVLAGNGDGTFGAAVTLNVGPGAWYPNLLTTSDLNEDGFTDLVVTNKNSGTVAVFLSSAAGVWGSAKHYSGGLNAYGVALGDFNADGHQDLALASATSGTFVLFGNGDGTFRSPRAYDGGVSPYRIAIADFNGDGIKDFANTDQSGTGLYVYFGAANGDFSPAPGSPINTGTARGTGILAKDLNQDGSADIAIADRVGNSVLVYLNNGDGTFASPTVRTGTGALAYELVAADVDADDVPDLAALSFSTGTISIFKNNGIGGFGPATNLSNACAGGSGPFGLATGDVNGDGFADFVCGTRLNAAGNIGVFLNAGFGLFMNVPTYVKRFTVPGEPWSVAVADVNGDGRNDVLASGWNASPDKLTILPGTNDGSLLGAPVSMTGINSATHLIASDFNNDGITDIFAANSNISLYSTGVFRGTGGGAFEAMSSYESGPNSAALAIGDVNGDGSPDMLVATTKAISVLFNNGGVAASVTSSAGTSQYGEAVTYTATLAPTFPYMGFPIGNVTFLADGTPVGTVAAAGGVATISDSTVPVGLIGITAEFAGDPIFNRTVSPAYTQNVTQAGTTSTLIADSPASAPGGNVTFTATVTPNTSGTPTGWVNFDEGATTLSSEMLVGGVATFTTNALAIGSHDIVARYTGDGNFSASDSPLLSHLVGIGTTTTIASAAAVTYPASGIVTVQVASGSGTPTGTVDLQIDGGIAMNVAVDGAGTATFTIPGLNAGIHTLTATYIPTGLFASSNVIGSIDVQPRTLSVVVNNKNKTYGQANPALDATFSGNILSDNLSVSLTTTAAQFSPVGDYAILANVDDPDGRLANYALTVTNGTLTISQATLTAIANNKTRVYGDPNPPLDGVLTGVQGADKITASYSTLAGNSSPVGPYAIVVALNDPEGKLPNYSFTTTDGTLAVTHATLTIVANDKARVYGTANPVFDGTVTGVKAGDSITATYSSPAVLLSNVGPYPITVGINDPGTRLSNYNVNVTHGTLTIGKAGITVAANSKSRAYGAANPLFDGTLTGVVAGDDITATYVTTAVVTSALAGYPIHPVLVDPGTRLGNYDVTSTDGTLTITAVPLTITTNNKSRQYGVSNPTLDGAIAGLVAGDDITVNWTTTATISSPIGDYSITAILVDPAGRAGNYTTTNAGGTLHISSAPLTVAANSKSRPYGVANPIFDGTLNGVLAEDNITATYTTAAVPASPVGTYTVTPVLGDLDGRLGNYSVVTTNGTLTVTAAVLAVSANDKVRTYGQLNPPLDGVIDGIVLGQNITATYTTPATATSNVAFYQITPVLNDPTGVLSNYSVTITKGILTVNKATLTATAANKSRAYGTTNPTLDGTLVGVTAGDAITATYGTDAVLTSEVGAYPITVGLIDPGTRLGNYDVTLVPGTLTVVPATTVTTLATSPSPSNYGQTVTLTATVSSAASGATGNVTFSEEGHVLGVVAIDASGVASLPLPMLGAGTHTFVASYGGESHFGTSTTTATHTINKATTALALTANQNPVDAGSTVTFTAKVTSPLVTPTGSVKFLDGTTLLSTVSLNGSGVATYSTSALNAALHNITAQYDASNNFTASTSTVLSQAVQDYTIASDTTSTTLRAGQSATVNLTVTPIAGYNKPVQFSCGPLPALVACTFVPASVTPNGTPIAARLVISTTGPHQASAAQPALTGRPSAPVFLTFASFGAMGIVLAASGTPRKRTRVLILLGLSLLLLVGLVGCAGSPSSAPMLTPPGTSTITVTATGGSSTSHAVSFTLTVQI